MEKTNPKNGRTLAVLLFDAYQEYRRNHYPSDPKVYVIRAHPATINDLTDYIEGNLRLSHYGDETPWGFRLQADLRLEEDTIVFGPETIEIKWERE